MIIIFDTYGGLCNQFYDINCGISFCINHNIKFTFRYCSFRNKDLVSWANQPFNNLFDMNFLKNKYAQLYVDYKILNITSENTYNYTDEFAVNLFTNVDIINEIQLISQTKDFIILKQFWPINNSLNINNLFRIIRPCKRLMKIYNKLKPQITNNKPYNFLHYRYESDFTNHFNCKIDSLSSIITKIKSKFKNPDLKIYVATSNIKQLISLNKYPFIITKNEDELSNYNYEELAFIDYMFGDESNEVFGHSKSAFSNMLNNLKNTSNYYD